MALSLAPCTRGGFRAARCDEVGGLGGDMVEWAVQARSTGSPTALAGLCLHCTLARRLDVQIDAVVTSAERCPKHGTAEAHEALADPLLRVLGDDGAMPAGRWSYAPRSVPVVANS